MGCFWSSECSSESHDRPINNRSRSTGDLLYRETHNYTIQQTRVTQRRAQSIPRPTPRLVTQVKPEPVFGTFKCMACGHTWNSRYCWPNSFQICRKCKRRVYAHSQRQLLPSDTSVAPKGNQEHLKELCQMCQQLGYFCGNFGKRHLAKGNHYANK